MNLSNLTREEKERKFLLKKEKKKRNAKDDFWKFCLYMDREFFIERKDILKDIAIDLQRLIKPKPPYTELDILNVSLPPRTGKSYMTTLFVAWGIGHFHTESFMRNTVTAKLYNKFSNDLKDIIKGETHKSRYNEIFPNIELLSTATEGWKVRGSKMGITYFGAGIEGSIIGFGASKLSILDDSIADEFEALNDYALEKKWGWYGSAADTREEKGCKKLFMGTRWSPKDIVGMLESLGFFIGEKAKSISIQALINGKSYCEVIHSTEKLLQKKKLTSDLIWEAEWMQNPISAKGKLFKRDELNWFKMEEFNENEPDAKLSKVDTADRGTDYLAAPIGHQYDKKIYIIDVVYTQDGVEITIPLIAQACIEHKLDMMDIESNNGGSIFAKDVRTILKDKKHYLTTVTDTTTIKNKETRILMKSGYIKEYFYFREDYEEGTPYAEFVKHILEYKKGGKNKTDDAVDSLTGLAEMIEGYDPDRFEMS